MLLGPDDFTTTLQGLNSGIHIRHITTFKPTTCATTDRVIDILENPEYAGFDAFPVIDAQENIVVGVLERTSCTKDSIVGKEMRNLDSTLIISADSPLNTLIEQSSEWTYKLVLDEHGIDGIVTRSDLLKLPVRVLCFSYVSHLELLMAMKIRKEFGDSDQEWKRLLEPERVEKIESKVKNLKSKREELDLIEMMDFCDKREVIRKKFNPGNHFKKDLEEIEDLRNSLAHSGEFIGPRKGIKGFIRIMVSLQKWIQYFSEDLFPQER